MSISLESDQFRLVFQDETASLYDKISNKLLWEEEFHGNPNRGLIDPHNRWVVIAGIQLTLWKPNKIKKFEKENFKWIHSARIKSRKKVEVLIDPWSDISAIWELNTESFELTKVREFLDYRSLPYSDIVMW